MEPHKLLKAVEEPVVKKSTATTEAAGSGKEPFRQVAAAEQNPRQKRHRPQSQALHRLIATHPKALQSDPDS